MLQLSFSTSLSLTLHFSISDTALLSHSLTLHFSLSHTALLYLSHCTSLSLILYLFITHTALLFVSDSSSLSLTYIRGEGELSDSDGLYEGQAERVGQVESYPEQIAEV